MRARAMPTKYLVFFAYSSFSSSFSSFSSSFSSFSSFSSSPDARVFSCTSQFTCLQTFSIIML